MGMTVGDGRGTVKGSASRAPFGNRSSMNATTNFDSSRKADFSSPPFGIERRGVEPVGVTSNEGMSASNMPFQSFFAGGFGGGLFTPSPRQSDSFWGSNSRSTNPLGYDEGTGGTRGDGKGDIMAAPGSM